MNLHGGGVEESLGRNQKISNYTPVLRVPQVGKEFIVYVASQEHVIDAVLVQEDGGKEFIVAFVSQRLLDVKVRYAFLEKLCLSLYYACAKFRHYILMSQCTVVCQHDVIKYMLHKPILSGRLGKWAYSLIEYDLPLESLRARRGQWLLISLSITR
jgi:hypothetical protein